MSIGRTVRTRLGRFEAPVTDFYRSHFIDLDACARLLGETVQAASILEVGCGDGQMAEKLLERFPGSTYVGIDVAPEVGRLFRGNSTRARFRSIDSRSYLQATPERYDLVVLVDVLHHVPRSVQDAVLEDIRQLTALGGHYALKDWTRSRSLAHLAAWASDRVLTGDRVAYFDDEELRALIPARFPQDPEVLATRVAPRTNNVLLVYRRT